VPERPSLNEVEAAARLLHEAGRVHRWWKGEAYDELDPISKSEFDGLVEKMLIAASRAKGTTC
jgi:3-dehydro-4-phosphotetronate decarboxylase